MPLCEKCDANGDASPNITALSSQMTQTLFKDAYLGRNVLFLHSWQLPALPVTTLIDIQLGAPFETSSDN